MRWYSGFEEYISAQGGIVSRRELLDAGWTPDELRIAYGNYRRPTRLRRGWYCSADVPAEVREAWRLGGALACVSALRWYGVLPSIGDAAAVHICLPRHTHRRRVEAHTHGGVVRHWHALADTRDFRWAVPIAVALEQARHCSALKRDAGRSGDREQRPGLKR